MWTNYANEGTGICLEFEVKDYDILFPVEYRRKNKVDFTRMIIKSFKMNEETLKRKEGIIFNDPMSLYP